MDDLSAIVEVYRAHLGEKANSINLHRDYSQQFFTLVAAILGVSAVAAYHFSSEPWLVLVTGVGPLLNVLLCAVAIRMCDRFYRGFLEHITILAKLETLLGLATPLRRDSARVELPFPEDNYILPERWLQSRHEAASSTEFIKTHMRQGSNRIVRWTFLFLAAANTAFLIGIIAVVVLQVI
jgi:hypothetical protein